MRILPLKKHVNRDKCSFTSKQHMFGVFAIDEPGSLVRALYATLVIVIIVLIVIILVIVVIVKLKVTNQ